MPPPFIPILRNGNRHLAFLLLVFLLQACAAAAILPTSNILTHDNFADAHRKHDQHFTQQHPHHVHHVPRGEYTLYAIEFGQKFKHQRPTLLLMHGFPDSLHLYDLISPALGQAFHVVAFDFLGWGHSDKPDFHTYDTASLRADMEAVINYFAVQKLIPVVHDLSGLPGIDWVLDHPEQTAGLILLNTIYGRMAEAKTPEAIELFSTPSIRGGITRIGAYLSEYGWQQGFTNQINKFFSRDEQRKQFVPVFMDQAFAIKPAFFSLNDSFQADLDLRQTRLDSLRHIQVPVQIIFGADDPYLNPNVAHAFHGLFRHAQLFLVNGASHYVQLDQPKQVVTRIKQFAPLSRVMNRTAVSAKHMITQAGIFRD